MACSKAQDPHYDTEPKHKAQVSRKMGLQEAMIAELRQEKEVLLAKIAELQAENDTLNPGCILPGLYSARGGLELLRC